MPRAPKASPYRRHVARWRNCRQCELCNQRRLIVFARGKVPCDVLFVGEAPGASENCTMQADGTGKPFVGPAGKLLDYIISQSLPDGTRYALTNLVACFPKVAKEAGVNEPPEEAIMACQDRLQQFIDLCSPTVLVAVGKLAAKWVEADVAIPHPAALLRLDVSQKGLAIQRAIVVLADAVEEYL